MQNDLNSRLGQTPAAGRRRRASGSIDPALHNKHNANGQRQIITPTRRSCPIHGLKPVVFTDTRLDRRVGGMEKCAHPRTEVRGFRRHFFIKCENHSGAILLLKFLFKNNELFTVISKAKEERIDKQYYVKSKQMAALTENSTKELFISAESFPIDIKQVIINLKKDEIKK